MVGEAVTDVTAGLLATGFTAGTGDATSKVRSSLRQDRVSVDLGMVAMEFSKALERAIEAENASRDTTELAGFTDNWQAINEELAATPTAPERARNRCEAARARFDELDHDLPNEREQLEHVCADIPEE